VTPTGCDTTWLVPVAATVMRPGGDASGVAGAGRGFPRVRWCASCCVACLMRTEGWAVRTEVSYERSD